MANVHWVWSLLRCTVALQQLVSFAYFLSQLSMPTSQLVENIKRLLETVETFKPRGTNPGTFITKVELKCPPTTEKFLIACGELLEDYVKADVDEVEKEEGDEEKVAEQAAAQQFLAGQRVASSSVKYLS